ncbi:MAG: hypothetical protein ACK5V3_03865 [Bdellovibrionales bacterium]
MISRFETAKKGTPRFQLLLNGVVSKDERSLPIVSLQNSNLTDEMTFEIKDKAQTPKFQLFFFLKSLLRVRYITLLVFPLFYSIFLNWEKPLITSIEILCIVAGLLACYAAVQLRIDRRDFESGYDQLRPNKDLSYLRSGMVSVLKAKKWEQRLVGLSLGFGLLPLSLELGRIAAVATAVAFIVVADRLGSAQQNRFVRDAFLSLTAGPVLAFGIQPDISSIGFGLVWSLLIFFSLQIDHLENFFAQTKAGEVNFLNAAGFDFAGRRLWWSWGAFVLGYAIWSGFKEGLSLWVGSSLILFFFSLSWKKNLLSLKSSLGSDLIKCSNEAHQLVSMVLLLWVSELLFKAWVAPLVFLWAN